MINIELLLIVKEWCIEFMINNRAFISSKGMVYTVYDIYRAPINSKGLVYIIYDKYRAPTNNKEWCIQFMMNIELLLVVMEWCIQFMINMELLLTIEEYIVYIQFMICIKLLLIIKEWYIVYDKYKGLPRLIDTLLSYKMFLQARGAKIASGSFFKFDIMKQISDFIHAQEKIASAMNTFCVSASD